MQRPVRFIHDLLGGTTQDNDEEPGVLDEGCCPSQLLQELENQKEFVQLMDDLSNVPPQTPVLGEVPASGEMCSAKYSADNRWMQEAFDRVGKWASNWCVETNTTKTITMETVELKMNRWELEQEDTPTYLGVKLDKRLTWDPQLEYIKKKATRKLVITKKLAGKFRAPKATFCRSVCGHRQTSNGVRQLVFGRSIKDQHQSPEQSTKHRTTADHWWDEDSPHPSSGEVHQAVHPLEDRCEEKVYTHSEKLLHMPTHPVHT
nr:hypothetical protein BaRGS_001909 [Batillaria attramentaria]